MSVLDKRDVPDWVKESLSPDGWPVTIQQLLLNTATRPSRRRKVFRLRYLGRYLWLHRNKTLFHTRASARNMIINWLYDALLEISCTAEHGKNYRYSTDCFALRKRMGMTDTRLGDPKQAIERAVDHWLETGLLVIEELVLLED